MQKFKSVYFPDFPADNTKARNLKLAFGQGDESLWKCVDSMSGEDIRCRFGASYHDLRASAEAAGLSLNAFCLGRLREALGLPEAGEPPSPTIDTERVLVDPIQVTFRGGIKEPLQGWYPYLEGYSPDFVKVALERYAPGATHVLDPFGGSGTTPLTAARLGLSSSYCELNPILQLLIDAKADALIQSQTERAELAGAIVKLTDDLPGLIRRNAPDRGLRDAYSATFGASQFFDEATFDECLRARTWLDALASVQPTVAKLASVALTSALLPASNLIRRGDVRFRKGPAEVAAKVKFIPEAAAGLQRIARDILSLDSVAVRPRLLTGDAKQLLESESVGADVVVTSPPYLNGTNYYRNTKLELWFIRALTKADDLSDLRRRTVTAGINDVTNRPAFAHANESIAKLLRELGDNCYDRRIPQMASHYFEDMGKVLRGLTKHTIPGAPLLLDIGDSAYSGIHVDTPTILAEIMKQTGWTNVREVPLRQRMSRGGLKLRQVLLVGERGQDGAPSAPAIERSPSWHRRWASFKADLPHQTGDYAKRNWGSPLHSLCSYQGKMKPALAKHLAETFVSPGGRMLDVFTGVGTIPFEAASLGATTFGFDISAAALPVASAKLSTMNAAACEVVLDRLNDFITGGKLRPSDHTSYEDIKFNGLLPSYFHKDTFREILLARRFFQKNGTTDAASCLVFACLLHVLHGNRPYALSRRSHSITPFAPSGDFIYKSLIEKVAAKLRKALKTERPASFVPGETIRQDATTRWPDRVNNLDAIITSPPFFDSTRFYLANWMRLWLAGWTATDFKTQPIGFVDEMQKKTMSIYTPILRQARERLRAGGVCVMHLGDSKKCNMAEEIEKLARPIFSRAEIFSESVSHCESHGIRDKGTVTAHTYLVLS